MGNGRAKENSSPDLAHWTFRNQVLKVGDPENLGPRRVVERPKVFYNAKTRTWVMYLHIDDGFMGDIWKPRTQWDSRYLWMPVEIGEGKLWLPAPKPWTLDIATGESRILN